MREGWDINFRRRENSVRKKNCNDVKEGRDCEIIEKKIRPGKELCKNGWDK